MDRKERDRIETAGVEHWYLEAMREPTNDEIERLEAFNVAYNLVQRYGLETAITKLIQYATNADRFQREA